MKILEKELKEKIKMFENKTIIVQFENFIQARFEFYNTHINYNTKTGFLHIEDSKNDNEIRINIVSAIKIDLIGSLLNIKLDNSIEIRIMIK